MVFPHRTPNADSKGKLHPEVTETDLYHLLDGRNDFRNITISTTRGCAVVPIPREEIGPSDRCYARVEVIGWKRTEEIVKSFDPKNPPVVHGLPITLSLSAADLPDLTEILERTIGYVPGEKTKYVNVIRLLARLFADDRARRIKDTVPKKRITVQKTEIDIQNQPGSLAGPSRGARPKPRYNPLGRADRA